MLSGMQRPEVLTRRCRTTDNTSMPHGTMCVTHWAFVAPGEKVCYFGEGIVYADLLERVQESVSHGEIEEALIYERGYDDGWNGAVRHITDQLARLAGK